MTKDTNEQLDEEIQRAKSGRIPSTGASVPWSWGFMEASLHSHDQLIPFPALLPFGGWGVRLKIPGF